MGIKGIKGKRIKISILVLCLALLCALVGTGAFFYDYIGKFSKNYDGSEGKKLGDKVNILLLGLDIGDVKQKENISIKRTDTIILFNYDTSQSKASLISIPRDTLIKINNNNQKINAAYAIGGDNAIKKAVEGIVKVPIDYLVKIDYDGFRELIDAIGGVEMKIDRNMYYDDNEQDLHINFKKGETVLLDGKKAEEFFRWRKNNDGTGFVNGDLDRIENQHKFINKIIEKCTSPAIIPKIGKVLEVLPKHIQTDMSPRTIVSLGNKYILDRNIKLNMYTLKGNPVTIDNLSYLIYDEDSNKDILNALEDKKITASTSVFSKDTLKIEILNGTRIAGLAAECKEALNKKGYKNIKIGNAYEKAESEIQLKDMDMKSLIQNDIEIQKITSIDKEDNKFDIIIILGKDYKKFGEVD